MEINRRTVLSATSAAALPAGAAAEEPGPKMLLGPPLSPQSLSFAAALISPGPHPDLGAAAADFAWLEGGWDAAVFDFDADGTVRQGSGEWWFAWVLEGRALQDVWIAPTRADRGAAAGPHAVSNRYGSTIRRFDHAAGLWRIVWINPVSGAENRLAGRRDGDRIVLLGQDEGRAIRWTFNAIRPDSFVWRGESEQAPGRWVLEAEFRVRRKA